MATRISRLVSLTIVSAYAATSLCVASCASDDNSGGEDDGAAPLGDASGGVAGDASGSADATTESGISSVVDAGNSDADAAADGSISPSVQHAFASGPVNTLTHVGSSWYVAGNFSRISKHNANGLVHVDSTGAPTGCSFDEGFDDEVASTLVVGTFVYVGGQFTSYQGIPTGGLVKIDLTTCELDRTFNPPGATSTDNTVFVMATSGSALYIGGNFQTYRGGAANGLAKLDLTTGARDTTFTAGDRDAGGFTNWISSLVVFANALYVGGQCVAPGGLGPGYLAKLDVATGDLDPTFLDPPHGAARGENGVLAIVPAANALYVVGDFASYQGIQVNGVAKIDPSTGALDPSFNPPLDAGAPNGVWGANGGTGPSANGIAMSAAVSGSSLYIGGSFTSYRGAPAHGIAKLDRTTGELDTTFSPPAAEGVGSSAATFGGSFSVAALAVSGSSVYIGGTFDEYRGVKGSAFQLAKLDATSGGLDATFLPADSHANGVDGDPRTAVGVAALTVSGSDVWIGGTFTVYGGDRVDGIVKLDDTTYDVDTMFRPSLSDRYGGTPEVDALASDDDNLYISGSFTATGGVAKIDRFTGATDAAFLPPTGHLFSGAIAAAGDSLYVTDRSNLSGHTGLAKLDLTTGSMDPSFDFDQDGGVVVTQSTAFAASGTSLYFAGLTAVTGAANIGRIDVVSGQLDTSFAGAPFNSVLSLAADSTELYAGSGPGPLVPSGAAVNFAKVDLPSGAIDTTFTRGTGTMGAFDRAVETVVRTSDGLYVGGSFSSYRGVPNSALGLAKLDPVNGGLDPIFVPPPPVASPDAYVEVSAIGASDRVILCARSTGSGMSTELRPLDPKTGAVE